MSNEEPMSLDPADAIASALQSFGHKTKQQRDESRDRTVALRVLKRLRPDVRPATVETQLGRKLRLDDVGALVQDFPVNVCGAAVDYVATMTVADLMGSGFWKSPLFKEYDRQLALRGWDDDVTNVGMVFTWPGIGDMVLHTWPRAVELQNRHKGYSRVMLLHSKRATPRIYVLERLETFLDLAVEAMGG
jgi:hypothetical protein